MRWQDGRHPVWGLLRIAVVGGLVCVVLGLFLAFNYQNGWSPNDVNTLIGTVLTALGALFGFDKLKSLMTKDDSGEPKS